MVVLLEVRWIASTGERLQYVGYALPFLWLRVARI